MTPLADSASRPTFQGWLVGLPSLDDIAAVRAEALKHLDDLPTHVVALVQERFLRADTLTRERLPSGLEASGRDAWTRISVIHDAAMHVGHILGVACAHSESGVVLLEEAMDAIREHCEASVASAMNANLAVTGLDAIDAIERCASEVALLEAANAWTWVPQEQCEVAADVYPWIVRADAWIAGRAADPDHVRAKFAHHLLAWMAEQHDLMISSVIARLDQVEIPEAAYGEVASHVRAQLRALKAALLEHAPWNLADPPLVDSLMLVDAKYVAALEAMDSKGKSYAERAREVVPAAAAERGPWYGWLPSLRPVKPPMRLSMLAKAVWYDIVEPALKRANLRRPAIVRAVVGDRLIPLMTRQATLPGLDDDTVRDERGRVLGRIALTTDATLEAVRRGAQGLGTVTGNRLIRALIHRSHDAWNRGEQLPNRVAFEGGWLGLLNALGVSQKYQQQLKEIAKAGQCIVWQTPHVKLGGLWLWSERRGTKAGPGEVSFTLGDALTPGYGDTLSREGGSSLPARIARRLVPELRYEPPMGGARELDHGSIWTLHRLVLLEFVDHAEELAKNGSVAISDGRWRELCSKASTPQSILSRTQAAWVAGESDRAPALLARDGKGGWTLAQPHEPELHFIAGGGAARAGGRKPKRKRRSQASK